MEGYLPCPDCQALVRAEALANAGCPFCNGAAPPAPVAALPQEAGPAGIRQALVLVLVLLLMVPAGGLGFWATLDLDEDGLSTWEEWRLGTASAHADSDRDGLADGWEVQLAMSPLRTESDGDGIDDGEEVRLGTDPRAGDSDGDGLTDCQEVRHTVRQECEDPAFTGPYDGGSGTDPRVSDSDGDRVSDSRELTWGSDPLLIDSDGDGLFDDVEWIEGSDPRHADSDRDGIPDGEEPLGVDCDGDGVDALLDPDDDDDGRVDGEEPVDHRCDPDVDGDGILDGDEANATCIVLVDCDQDGLPDDIEHATAGFDPLDPDSFGVGLTDGVVWAFQQAGQPPSTDEDGDAIPDAWEETSGLIDWGPYTPKGNRTDLLIEFVKVQGPDSKRLATGLDFTPSYERIVQAFAAADITLQYQETVVTLPQEERPPFLPSYEETYYQRVLGGARYTDNPYVTTVVLNPQHDQSGILHGGAAPIRGMVATVDYGVYTHIRYGFENGTLTLRPFYESLIAGGQSDAIQALGFTEGGVTDDGQYGLRDDGYLVLWQPHWFATDPTIHWSDGDVSQTTLQAAWVQEVPLAHVILHELGHTLGLCHTQELDCRALLDAADQQRFGETAMFSGSDTNLRFLDSEWQRVQLYMQCPPQQPIVLVSQDADREAILANKYHITYDNALAVGTRACQQLQPLPVQFGRTESEPYESLLGPMAPRLVWHDETRFVPAWPEPQWATNDASNTRAYWGIVTLATALVAAVPLVGYWSRRTQPQ